MIIGQGLFRPDESRARRWSNAACKSLQEAMNFLARPTASLPQEHLDECEAASPISEGWHLFGSDCEVSISSNSDGESEIFEKDCNTSEEDREAEVSAP